MSDRCKHGMDPRFCSLCRVRNPVSKTRTVRRRTTDTASQHSWRVGDDIVALYLYRHGPDLLGRSWDAIASALGMTTASLRMRVANFRAIDGGGGLAHFGRQSTDVWETHNRFTEPELRTMAHHAIENG